MLHTTMFRARGLFAGASVAAFGAGPPAGGEIIRMAEFPIPDTLFALPVEEAIILSTLQGRVVSTRVRVRFETFGGFDAAGWAISLVHGSRQVSVNGQGFGWGGQGSFEGELTSDGLNGEIDFGGNPWATWLMITSVATTGGGQQVGTFTESAFIVSYAPDCQGDVNQDGFVGAADIAALLGAWGTDGAATFTDLSGDGVVNAADLALLLGQWGVCPCPQCQ